MPGLRKQVTFHCFLSMHPKISPFFNRISFFYYILFSFVVNGDTYYAYVDESYAQGLLVLEQCYYTQPSEGRNAQNWRGAVLLAMSTLLYERFCFL